MLETKTRVALPAATLPAWRFWVPLGLQVLLLAAVPMQKLPAYAAGTAVVLRTMPVDPVDPLRGRYVRLGYELAREDAMKRLPGWHEGMGERVYFTLAPGQPAWQAVAIASSYPASVPAGDVVLPGKVRGGSVEFELEEYYIPENQGDRVSEAIKGHPTGNLAEIKVARNQTDEAVRLYQRAADADSSWGKPLFKLGTIAMNKGDKQGALKAMTQVIAIDPTSPEAAQARTAVEQLK